MKKILISIFSIILAVTLTACGSANNSSNNKDLKKVYNMEKMHVLNGLNEVRLNSLTFISIHFY